MNEVKLNSYYYEIGERSFMKEHVAYQVWCSRRPLCSLLWVQAPQSVGWSESWGLTVRTNRLEHSRTEQLSGE